MNILSIDTSTKNFSLAVAREGRVVRYRNIVLDKVLESSIIPAIEKILRDSKLKFKDVDGYAVGLGPGSFTSLRVGLSTIKAFALATGKPVVGISSLDVIAMNVIGEKADEICTVMDARRKQIYACLYEKKDGVLKRKTDYLLTNVDDLLDRVHGRTLFVGDGLALWREAIKEKYAKAGKKGALCQAVFAGEKSAVPQASKLSDLVYGRFEKKVYDDVETLVPIYLYSQDCQVQN
jgi:tRNA threonylcarbamoyladenosine biosynthesis protein TsaB